MLTEAPKSRQPSPTKSIWIEYGRKNREIDNYALVYEFTDASGAKHA